MSIKTQRFLRTPSNLQEVADFFSLGQVEKSRILDTGIANENHLISTKKGEYVVRGLITQREELIQNDLAIERQLSEVGIVSPKLITSESGQYIYKKGESKTVVLKKIIGTHPSVIGKNLLINIGRILAKFHYSVTQLPAPNSGWLSPESSASYLIKPSIPEEIFFRCFSFYRKRLRNIFFQTSQGDYPRRFPH